MPHDSVTTEKPQLDFKATGYIVSIVSVLLLGAAAWPSPGEPSWIKPVLIAGMGASIAGMGLRYIAHLQQRREMKRAKQAARS
jgi:hypothetical protein